MNFTFTFRNFIYPALSGRILLRTLHTSKLQFGFKKKLSATIATTIFTETVDYYLNQGGVVYALAPDASKAFDRVEFSKMFNNLLDRGLNVLYTRLLFHMYVQQTIRVRFNQSYSNYFKVANGVKQGGVLSPHSLLAI